MGKYSRDKGVRFERTIARKFREAGFLCRRVLEYDGHSHGTDLQVGVELRPFSKDHPQVSIWLKAGIQCKATQNPRDLEIGLQQCIDGNPTLDCWVCLHSHERQLRIGYTHKKLSGVPPFEELTWAQLLERLWALCPVRTAHP